MERLIFKECENCKDWTGCIVDCINDCGKPLDAMEEFNKYKSLEEQGKMIDENRLIKRFKQLKGCDSLANMFIKDVIREIENQPKIGEWIPCSEQLPNKAETIVRGVKE